MAAFHDHRIIGIDVLDSWFTYHPPTGDQTDRYEALRFEARTFAMMIRRDTPPGVEQDRAFAALREAIMWANAAIACGGDT